MLTASSSVTTIQAGHAPRHRRTSPRRFNYRNSSTELGSSFLIILLWRMTRRTVWSNMGISTTGYEGDNAGLYLNFYEYVPRQISIATEAAQTKNTVDESLMWFIFPGTIRTSIPHCSGTVFHPQRHKIAPPAVEIRSHILYGACQKLAKGYFSRKITILRTLPYPPGIDPAPSQRTQGSGMTDGRTSLKTLRANLPGRQNPLPGQ